VNRENYEVYPIIVRPNEYYDLEDEFIKNELASRDGITYDYFYKTIKIVCPMKT